VSDDYVREKLLEICECLKRVSGQQQELLVIVQANKAAFHSIGNRLNWLEGNVGALQVKAGLQDN